MKKIIIIILTVCLASIHLRAQENDSKAKMNYNGYDLKRFFSKNFTFRNYTKVVVDSVTGPVRILCSFIIKSNGELDSLQIHESTSTILETDVKRILMLSKTHWTPEIRNGKPVDSAPFFWVIYIDCPECDDQKEIHKENYLFYKNYPYSSLPNWREGSVILVPPTLIFMPPSHSLKSLKQ